jgi:HK97 family phage portal protein
LYGNAYAVITRDDNGAAVSIMPVPAAQVTPYLDAKQGDLWYDVHIDGKHQWIGQADMLHWRGMSADGITGVETLAHASRTISLGRAVDDSVNSTYAKGGKSHGVISMPSLLRPEQREQIREAEIKRKNAGLPVVLEAGMTWTNIGMTADEMQALEMRKMNIEDAARFFGVPPVLIGHAGGTSMWGTGVQELKEGWVAFHLAPMMHALAAEIHYSVLTAEQRIKYTVEFSFDALLRSSIEKRYEAYSKAIPNGVLTPNEARQRENDMPLEGGDQLFIQGATVPITQAGVRNGISPNFTN